MGPVPLEYVAYFRVPALIYYASTAMEMSTLSDIDELQLYQCYFIHIQMWMEKHDPFVRYGNLMSDWKTRPDMARKILIDHGIPDRRITDYLNNQDWFVYVNKGGVLLADLPNIDALFEEQNNMLADAFSKANTLILSTVFNSLNEEEQCFIQQGKVNLVRIHGGVYKYRKNLPLDLALMKPVMIMENPEHIDFLQCIVNEEKRIYALDISNRTKQQYTLQRVNFDKKLFNMLANNSIQFKPNMWFTLTEKRDLTVKEEGESPKKLIESLTTKHKKSYLMDSMNKVSNRPH